MSKLFKAKLVMALAPASPELDTRNLFDIGYKETSLSPIDEFLNRLSIVNRLAPKPAEFDTIQAQLVLLGVIAAVESYLRTILRKIISVDRVANECVHRCEVSYGAAIHLSKELLPEAVLEKFSFVSKRSIIDALRDLIGIKGEPPVELVTAIDAYVRVCQLRHCAVHRFGKLGANNAIALGLSDHGKLLEKPLQLDYASLQNAILIATNIVREINNHLYSALMSRLEWRWDYRQDKADFQRYHALFAIKTGTAKSPPPRDVYDSLKGQYREFVGGK